METLNYPSPDDDDFEAHAEWFFTHGLFLLTEVSHVAEIVGTILDATDDQVRWIPKHYALLADKANLPHPYAISMVAIGAEAVIAIRNVIKHIDTNLVEDLEEMLKEEADDGEEKA